MATVLANGTDANKNLAGSGQWQWQWQRRQRQRQRVQDTIQLNPLIEIDIIGRARLRLLFLLFRLHNPKDGKKGEALWSVPCKLGESAAEFWRLACAVQQPASGPYYPYSPLFTRTPTTPTAFTLVKAAQTEIGAPGIWPQIYKQKITVKVKETSSFGF